MRKLAKLVVIDEIKEHPNADSLELAIIGGWQVCVRKGEFSPQCIAIYMEIDSMLPLDDPQFAFLAGRNEREVDGKRYARIKTMKLRGELSQGLLIPITDPEIRELTESLLTYVDRDGAVEMLNMALSLDYRLGIIKYEPKQSGAVLSGEAKGNFPSFIRKTDQERYQNCKRKYEDARAAGEVFEVSVKLDGSSFTAYINDGETGFCSRNLELKKDKPGNVFYDMFVKYDLDAKLREFSQKMGESGNFAIQGEVVGPGIQCNFENLEEHRLFVYSVYDIDAQEYLKPSAASHLVKLMGLDYVPVLKTFSELPLYEELQEWATGPSAFNGKYREGIVFKSEEGDFTFKAVSTKYLLKEK
jgi:RNA ligase (TIGR02306 family)